MFIYWKLINYIWCHTFLSVIYLCKKYWDFLYNVFLTFIDTDQGDDMGCYDAFDLHNVDEEEFDHSESEDDIGGTSSGSKTSLGFEWSAPKIQ